MQHMLYGMNCQANKEPIRTNKTSKNTQQVTGQDLNKTLTDTLGKTMTALYTSPLSPI